LWSNSDSGGGDPSALGIRFVNLDKPLHLVYRLNHVRRDSMRVFALHQPEADDELMWGDPYVQLIFEICDACHCIRVSNQCT
jgi:hypothetical protein